MGAHRYKCYNSAMVTTASQTGVATGTSIKTMLQIAPPSTRELTLVSWGFSSHITPTSGTSVVELLQTDVAATVTAHVAAGVQPVDPNAPASAVTLGTSATGFTASAEGTITTTRMFDAVELAPTAGAYQSWYNYQFTNREAPIIAISKFLRVRVTMGVSVNLICWVVWEE